MRAQHHGRGGHRLRVLIGVTTVGLLLSTGGATARPMPKRARQQLALLTMTRGRPAARATVLASQPWLGVVAQGRSTDRPHVTLSPHDALSDLFGGGGPSVSMGGLGCAQTGDCSAFGSYNDALQNPQAAIWNESGGRWERGVEVIAPPNAISPAESGATLTGLACPAAGGCVAIGVYLDHEGNVDSMLLTESAGRWAPATQARMPANQFRTNVPTFSRETGESVLTGVSCASSSTCVAVGYYLDKAGSAIPVMVFDNAGHWSSPQVVSPPSGAPFGQNVPYLEDLLTGVSCSSDGTCTAVGSYDDSNLALQGWAVTEAGGAIAAATPLSVPSTPDTPDSNPQVELTSVSCVSSMQCAAVGTYAVDYNNQSSGEFEPLALSESGGTWTSTEVALPADAEPVGDPATSLAGQQAAMLSVACAVGNTCSAVGEYMTPGLNIDGVELSSSGGAWGSGQQMAAPVPASGPATEEVVPGQISCSFTNDCAALAAYVTPTMNVEPLLAVQSSGSWSSTPVTLPANASVSQNNAAISGIACPAVTVANAASDCTLVDDYTDRSGDAEGFAATQNSTGAWGRPTPLVVPPASISEAELSLNSVAIPHGSAAKIPRILKNRGYTFHYSAVEPSRLTVTWHARYQHRSVVIARGAVRPKAARTYRLKLKLTHAGIEVMQTTTLVRVVSTADFRARTGLAFSGRISFVLHR